MKFLERGAVRVDSIAPQIRWFGHVAFLKPDGGVVMVSANAAAEPSRIATKSGSWSFHPTLPHKSVATCLWRSAR